MMPNSIILFDGVCNLCSGLVKFVLKHEKDHLIKFGMLQSPVSRELLIKYNYNIHSQESIIFIENGHAWEKSAAVFRITEHMKAPWSWLSRISFLPVTFTDKIYTFVAKHRYRFFGKKSTCMVPEPAFNSRFLMN